MTLLDTNVLSELMRPTPARAVLAWVDAQPAGEVWISAVTLGEIRLGLELLPPGRRRDRISAVADAMLHQEFGEACLPYDATAATEYAAIVASRTRAGRPISVEDAQIAAIAKSADLMLATRNVRDFEAIDGLRLIDPWAGSSPSNSDPPTRS